MAKPWLALSQSVSTAENIATPLSVARFQNTCFLALLLFGASSAETPKVHTMRCFQSQCLKNQPPSPAPLATNNQQVPCTQQQPINPPCSPANRSTTGRRSPVSPSAACSPCDFAPMRKRLFMVGLGLCVMQSGFAHTGTFNQINTHSP